VPVVLVAQSAARDTELDTVEAVVVADVAAFVAVVADAAALLAEPEAADAAVVAVVAALMATTA
jgi:hypothetical protein